MMRIVSSLGVNTAMCRRPSIMAKALYRGSPQSRRVSSTIWAFFQSISATRPKGSPRSAAFRALLAGSKVNCNRNRRAYIAVALLSLWPSMYPNFRTYKISSVLVLLIYPGAQELVNQLGEVARVVNIEEDTRHTFMRMAIHKYSAWAPVRVASLSGRATDAGRSGRLWREFWGRFWRRVLDPCQRCAELARAHAINSLPTAT